MFRFMRMEVREREQEQLNAVYGLHRKGAGYSLIVCIYLFICFLEIITVLSVFNYLSEKHDRELSGNIGGLIAEKVNNSINYLTESARMMAEILPGVQQGDLNNLYRELGESKGNHLSCGIIGIDGRVYGNECEKQELVKWDLVEKAKQRHRIFVSEPYRSGVTGKLVFTILTPLKRAGIYVGTLFVTYPLEEIQNMANTNVLSDEVEIYLMNAYSGNVILCSGTDAYRIGNWSNTKLYSNQIKTDNPGEYQAWEEKMRDGTSYGEIAFSLNDIDYIQVYERIHVMEGWSVVVRIPSSSLSDVMVRFKFITIIFVVTMIFTSVIMFLVLNKKEMEEKRILENLSVLDPLTRILNRRAFEYMTETYLAANAEKDRGALLFLDIDFFKEVNDRFGHDAGDQILVGFAECLQKVFTKDAVISRFGGDEFIILIKKLEHQEELDSKLELLRKLLKDIVITDAKASTEGFSLHFSAGIAGFPESGTDLKTLFRNADCALYEAKETGRNSYKWYEEKRE